MSISKVVDGHRIETGDEFEGQGRRILVDGNDVTEDALVYLGPRHENRGLKVPHGSEWAISTIGMGIRNGNIVVTMHGIDVVSTPSSEPNNSLIGRIRRLVRTE